MHPYFSVRNDLSATLAAMAILYPAPAAAQNCKNRDTQLAKKPRTMDLEALPEAADR